MMIPTVFDGTYKTQRHISYNNEKTLGVKELLKNTNMQRDQRERQRKLESRATQMQRRYRKKMKRLGKMKQCRLLFQDLIAKLQTNIWDASEFADVVNCVDLLCCFYRPSSLEDGSLMSLLLLLQKPGVMEHMASPRRGRYYDVCSLALVVRLAVRNMVKLPSDSPEPTVHQWLVEQSLGIELQERETALLLRLVIGGGFCRDLATFATARCPLEPLAAVWSLPLRQARELLPQVHYWELVQTVLSQSLPGACKPVLQALAAAVEPAALASAAVDRLPASVELLQLLLAVCSPPHVQPAPSVAHGLVLRVARLLPLLLQSGALCLARHGATATAQQQRMDVDSGDDDSSGEEGDGAVSSSDSERSGEPGGSGVNQRCEMTDLEHNVASLLRHHFCPMTVPRATLFEQDQQHQTWPDLICALGRLYHLLVMETKTLSAEHSKNLVIGLISSSRAVSRQLWQSCVLQTSPGTGKSVMQQVIDGQITCFDDGVELFFGKLLCFANCLHWRLLSVQDLDLVKMDESNCTQVIEFDAEELCGVVLKLRDIMHGLIVLVYPSSLQTGLYRQFAAQSSSGQAKLRPRLVKTFMELQRVVVRLYNRDVRKGLRAGASGSHRRLDWVKQHMFKISPKTIITLKDQIFRETRFGETSSLGSLSVMDVRQIVALKEMPFLVPFEVRMTVFKELVHSLNRESVTAQHQMMQHSWAPVRVRRDHLYEDAFSQVTATRYPHLWSRLKIEFVDSLGMLEAGIDGGGLLKEFLQAVLRESCDPKRGLFVTTTNNMLYPNPDVDIIYTSNWRQHFFFFGRMLALAVAKDMLMDVDFAPFFIQRLFSRHAWKDEMDIDNLQYLDEELYRNLLSLKSMTAVEDMCLDFTITRSRYGATDVVELRPDGANVFVTNANKIDYIYQVANYKLNRQIAEPTAAIRTGMDNVLPVPCFRLFDSEELGTIITGSGGSGASTVDLADLRRNTVYHGMESVPAADAIIANFWRVLEELSALDRRRFVQFVTSVSRAPLLGFSELSPRFAVQLTPDTQRLPTASTCINLLKLPCYRDIETMRHKLLTALFSQTGFHLS